MSRIIFDIDLDRCTACGACSIACMDQNDIDFERGDLPFREVRSFEAGNKSYYVSMACMHCADAPCVSACPVGCLYKDPETGLTLYDNSSCIGCHSCAMACPFGAPKFYSSGKMEKCDGCAERIRHGMEPACVRICPVQALRVYTEEEYAQAKLGRSLTKIISP